MGLTFGSADLEPFVGAAGIRIAQGGFTETGGATALTGRAGDHDLGTTTVGLRTEARLTSNFPLKLQGLLAWRHAYGETAPTESVAFGATSQTFTVSGVPIDREALVMEAGLGFAVSPAATLSLAYGGQIGERAQDHGVKGNFRYEF